MAQNALTKSPPSSSRSKNACFLPIVSTLQTTYSVTTRRNSSILPSLEIPGGWSSLNTNSMRVRKSSIRDE
ncbi:hypothetical protein K432DRAFT_459780 [Lepidopterella palustris CBS 459.81]|uniref:Uncharacterized protein n=1 Tax=Lepidopterella palustris CBS 459.81 TaxID=1314670 RepID=A0A8E2ELW1_9PEZI|nr:hypothetical protein K432DRAFT_459780 [Lepidopterella palustris CBS 459.81]